MLWQLDSLCFGKWELVVRLSMVTRHWDGQLGNHDAFRCGDKWILSSSKYTYTASCLVHVKGSLPEGKVAAGIGRGHFNLVLRSKVNGVVPSFLCMPI